MEVRYLRLNHPCLSTLYCYVDSLKSFHTIEVIRERVQDGVTGQPRDLQYTQCKIVGNGSFGVVFQTKLSPSGEDAAIKRVLQDKRFKVCIEFHLVGYLWPVLIYRLVES